MSNSPLVIARYSSAVVHRSFPQHLSLVTLRVELPGEEVEWLKYFKDN